MVRGRQCEAPIKLNDWFDVEHWRDGKLLRRYRFPNGVTNEGKNNMLAAAMDGGPAISTWYLALIDYTGYSALAAGDTYAEINDANGWDEFTDYTDPGNSDSATTRPGWTKGDVASQVLTNASPVVFDITSSGTVKGLALVGGAAGAQNKDDNTASGAVLFCTALFGTGDVPVNSGDQLKATLSVSM
jgi:hypothetical protein